MRPVMFMTYSELQEARGKRHDDVWIPSVCDRFVAVDLYVEEQPAGIDEVVPADGLGRYAGFVLANVFVNSL